MIIYEVYDVPTPWQAPGRNGNRYYNPKHKEMQHAIWQLKAQLNHEPLSCPLNVDMRFYFEPPKSVSKKVREQMLNGIIAHIVKPDRANLIKFIEDAMERAGIISNDSIIRGGEPLKLYGERAKTVLIIHPLKTEGQTYAYPPEKNENIH